MTLMQKIFGLGAVGILTIGILLRGEDPEITLTPERPPMKANSNGWYHAYFAAEIPATPPRMHCVHKTTRNLKKVAIWEKDPAYIGSTITDIKAFAESTGYECPASNTSIWGNPAPE